jgi:hypothetical protein
VHVFTSRQFGIVNLTDKGWTMIGEKGKENVLHTPEADTDPTDSLIEFFTKDKKGQEKYSEMTAELKKVLKA